jgi:hypothetical protein
MRRAQKGKELSVSLGNSIGAGATLFGVLKDASIDVIASSCYQIGDAAQFNIVPSDGMLTERLLRQSGFAPTMQDVLLVEMENEIGAFATLLQEISKLRVHVRSAYATTTATSTVLAILKTEDDERVLAEIHRLESEQE